MTTISAEPATGEISRRRLRRHRPTSRGSRIAYVYILPFFVVFAAFSVYPWLDTAWVSLHDVRLSTYHQQTWIGLDNYTNLLTNHFFWHAFFNTLTIGIISAVPQLCVALWIAHLLNHKLRGRTFFRVAILMPYATSLAAATVIFLELFNPRTGIIDWALHSSVLPEAERDPKRARAARLELDRPLGVLEGALAKSPWLAEDRFTVADLNAASVMYRALWMDLDDKPQWRDWLHRCWDRPAARQARAIRE